jgi:hypothetical protein
VNTQHLSSYALEKALMEKLREILGGVPWLKEWSVERNPAELERVYDILASVGLPNGKRVEWWVECKAEPRPSKFPYWVIPQENGPTGRRTTRVPTLGAPYITPNMARVCQDHHWDWFDLAGNCYLSAPEGIHLERSGNESTFARPRPTANLGTAEASRVIRALLIPENAGMRWTQREMENHFGGRIPKVPEPSLALVNKVVQHLREEAFIESAPEGGFTLKKPVALLEAWREAYRFDRHQRRSFFTLLSGSRRDEGLRKFDAVSGSRGVYASFSAAEHQAPHVRQPKQWFFIAEDLEDEFARCVEAKQVDSGENLVVLIPDDDGVFYGQESAGEPLASTNPVQTYVDLLNSGSRGQEAAEAILEQNLKPAWKLRGLE